MFVRDVSESLDSSRALAGHCIKLPWHARVSWLGYCFVAWRFVETPFNLLR
jgi:hypothetical protein